jgi:acyl CoA:acetate/3-ketoacid CoA transferase
LRRGQETIYVTERAVFRLSKDGIVLAEVAPGIDVRRDVLERMQFAPRIPAEPRIMSAAIFTQ